MAIAVECPHCKVNAEMPDNAAGAKGEMSRLRWRCAIFPAFGESSASTVGVDVRRREKTVERRSGVLLRELLAGSRT